jgi:small subunit ribosomal protein S4
MSFYRGPRLRIVRRLGSLPGLTRKISSKTNPPGQHGGLSAKKKVSQFSMRLKEKQKLRFHYGINERQLLNYLKKAKRKKGSSGVELLILLEMRLDNIIFRLGLAPTVVAAKQIINHGHILVDGRVVNISSFICKPLNIISCKSGKKSQYLLRNNVESFKDNLIPSHLSLNLEKLEGKVLDIINRSSILLVVNELLVIEYYSRKL